MPHASIVQDYMPSQQQTVQIENQEEMKTQSPYHRNIFQVQMEHDKESNKSSPFVQPRISAIRAS